MHVKTLAEVGMMTKAESMAYVADLTQEVDRLQRRSRAHRENIRSMSAKLEVANLKQELSCYVGMSRNPSVNTAAPTQAIRAVV